MSSIRLGRDRLGRAGSFFATLIVSVGCATAPDDEGSAATGEATETTSIVEEGDAAVWELATEPSIDETSTTFVALVSRLGCNGGETGVVFAPSLEFSDSEVIATFSVEPSPGGDCPGNDQVAYRVDLGEELGNRSLSDGACKQGTEAASTSHCSNGRERWTP